MPKNKERLSGKPYEDLIFKIYKELEPHAIIKKNDRIKGFESGIQREIDISLRSTIAGHEILMIIQAKDHKKSADIKIIGEFDSVIRDIRASRGILICNSGFTKASKAYAKNRGIDLFTVHDASNIDWKTEIKVPVIRKHSTIVYSLKVPFTITKEAKEAGPAKMRFANGPEGLILKKFDGSQTTFLRELSNLLNAGKIINKPGKHTVVFDAYLDFFENDKLFPPKPIEFEYSVSVRNYLKLFTPVDYRGVKDFITQKFKPTFLKIEDAIPFINDKTWQYIDDPKEISLDTIRLEVDIIDFNEMRFIKAAFKM